jgi:hypothetical protein
VSPIEKVSESIAEHQSAGRFVIDALCVLRESGGATGDEFVTLLPHSAFDFKQLLDQPKAPAVSRGALRDHLLALRVKGEFFSTDRLALAHIDARGDRWLIHWDLIRFNNYNGEAAPRDLWVLLCLEPGKQPLRSLTLSFNGWLRDPNGEETPMPEPVAAPQTIDFSD